LPARRNRVAEGACRQPGEHGGRGHVLDDSGIAALTCSLPSIYHVNHRVRWDADNEQHIARHGINPKEAEEAILIEPLEAEVQPHESEERVLCFGRTIDARKI
jgi:hypothetical protein